MVQGPGGERPVGARGRLARPPGRFERHNRAALAAELCRSRSRAPARGSRLASRARRGQTRRTRSSARPGTRPGGTHSSSARRAGGHDRSRQRCTGARGGTQRQRTHQREAAAVRRPVRGDARGHPAPSLAVRVRGVDVAVSHVGEPFRRRPGRRTGIVDDQACRAALEPADVEVGPAVIVHAGEGDPPAVGGEAGVAVVGGGRGLQCQPPHRPRRRSRCGRRPRRRSARHRGSTRATAVVRAAAVAAARDSVDGLAVEQRPRPRFSATAEARP